MKNIIFVYFLLFGVFILTGQNKEVEFKYKSGLIVKGLGKISGKSDLKFRKSRKDKKEKISFDELEWAIINDKEGNSKKYVQLEIKGKNKKIIVEELRIGRMNLYMNDFTSLGTGFASRSPIGSSGSLGFEGSNNYQVKNYFIKNEDEDYIEFFVSTDLFSKNFKKQARIFFQNCQLLVEKIESKQFKKKDILEIIDFYNNECD